MDNTKTEFLEEVNNCKGMIYHVCNIYTSEKEEREDLFQEVLYQLWKSFPNFQGKSKFSTWLYRVALNTAISYYGKQKRRIQHEQPSDHLPDMVEENNNNEYEISSLYRMIGNLGKIDKALVLLYLEDKSYDEIAEIMGMTVSNVGVRLNRAKKKLESFIRNETQDL